MLTTVKHQHIPIYFMYLFSSPPPKSSFAAPPQPPPPRSSYAAPPQPPPPGSSSYAAPLQLPPTESSFYAAPPQLPPPGSSSYGAPPGSSSYGAPPGSSSYASPSAFPHQPFYDCPSPDHTFTELSSPIPCPSSSYLPPPGLSTFPPPPQSAPQHPLPSFDFDSSTSTNSEETLEVFRPTVRVGQSGREPIPCTPTDLHMLTLLENMKHEMNKLSTMVNLLLSRSNNAASEPTSEMPSDIAFPLDTLDEVDRFEDWLKDPANAIKKKHMVAVLGSIGGRDTKHLTWNILAHIFSDGVAKKINWKGVNNKKKFSDMATKGLLARAVRKSHVAEKSTDIEINHHAIRWFNLASDRGGGRRERALTAQAQEAGVSQ
ncbi:pollen-specific leucine-rich repeat extensin-like protein 2 [Cheilinus undulatus]|uniref:pollen-specific leucine-rich repeat extensin-like protein 2 n=1 Tax=Cheilinus undulatus TaxID=241271 RepID=UPI001BD3D046|nr:pollen-specific leucine-rich repeat extensin-like protein 2 [Cheilinus undulatus]